MLLAFYTSPVPLARRCAGAGERPEALTTPVAAAVASPWRDSSTVGGGPSSSATAAAAAAATLNGEEAFLLRKDGGGGGEASLLAAGRGRSSRVVRKLLPVARKLPGAARKLPRASAMWKLAVARRLAPLRYPPRGRGDCPPPPPPPPCSCPSRHRPAADPPLSS